MILPCPPNKEVLRLFKTVGYQKISSKKVIAIKARNWNVLCLLTEVSAGLKHHSDSVEGFVANMHSGREYF